jgi:transcription initiation factor TFIID TATA-box-binding protein
MLTSEADIKVENVVATAALKHKIDLNALVKAFPEAEYRPKQFPGVVFRLKKPKTAALIFGSGKMVCTGARSAKEAGKALRKIVRTLKDGGIIITGKLDVKVVNIVASVNLGGPVDILELFESARDMRGRIIYEPEQFPGLIYRMTDPRAVFLIFSSGKVVCTGAKTEEDVHRSVNKLHNQLEEKELIRYE